MLTCDDLNGEFFEIQFLAATDRDDLRFIDAAGEREISRRPRADDFGAKLFGDERDIADVIRVAVAGKNIVGPLDRAEHRLFVSFPLFADTVWLFPGKKRIDEDDRLPNPNLPTGRAEPF